MTSGSEDPRWTGGIDNAAPAYRANVARIYDYWLGGKDNFAADREAGEAVRAFYPVVKAAAQANRRFHLRAAAWMARQGIRQFLDIGCGLPTTDTTHAVVRRERPGARVIYTDEDTDVLSHARALLARPGVVVVAGGVREPDRILRDRATVELLAPHEPTGLLLTTTLHFVADSDDPWGLVERYAGALAPGSCVAISHPSADNVAEIAARTSVEAFAHSDRPLHLRSRQDVRRFFAGLELLPPYQDAMPEVVTTARWLGPDVPCPGKENVLAPPGSEALWCGVGRKL